MSADVMSGAASAEQWAQRYAQLEADYKTLQELHSQSEQLEQALEAENNEKAELLLSKDREIQDALERVQELERKLAQGEDGEELSRARRDADDYKRKWDTAREQLNEQRRKDDERTQATNREIDRLQRLVTTLQEEKDQMARTIQTHETEISNLESAARVYKGWWDYWEEKHDMEAEKAAMLEGDLADAHQKYAVLHRRLNEEFALSDNGMASPHRFNTWASGTRSRARSDGAALGSLAFMNGNDAHSRSMSQGHAQDDANVRDGRGNGNIQLALIPEPALDSAREAGNAPDPEAEGRSELGGSSKRSSVKSLVPPLNLQGINPDSEASEDENPGQKYQISTDDEASSSDGSDEDLDANENSELRPQKKPAKAVKAVNGNGNGKPSSAKKEKKGKVRKSSSGHTPHLRNEHPDGVPIDTAQGKKFNSDGGCCAGRNESTSGGCIIC